MSRLETNLKTRELDHITLRTKPRLSTQVRDRDQTHKLFVSKPVCNTSNTYCLYQNLLFFFK